MIERHLTAKSLETGYTVAAGIWRVFNDKYNNKGSKARYRVSVSQEWGII